MPSETVRLLPTDSTGTKKDTAKKACVFGTVVIALFCALVFSASYLPGINLNASQLFATSPDDTLQCVHYVDASDDLPKALTHFRAYCECPPICAVSRTLILSNVNELDLTNPLCDPPICNNEVVIQTLKSLQDEGVKILLAMDDGATYEDTQALLDISGADGVDLVPFRGVLDLASQLKLANPGTIVTMRITETRMFDAEEAYEADAVAKVTDLMNWVNVFFESAYTSSELKEIEVDKNMMVAVLPLNEEMGVDDFKSRYVQRFGGFGMYAAPSAYDEVKIVADRPPHSHRRVCLDEACSVQALH